MYNLTVRSPNNLYLLTTFIFVIRVNMATEMQSSERSIWMNVLSKAWGEEAAAVTMGQKR